MKKALLIASVLFIAVISTACINNIAVQELNTKAAEYMQKGDFDSAINRLEASIDLDDSIYETYYNLGIAYLNAKKYSDAINAFNKGIKLKADFDDFYYSLALAQNELAEEILEGNITKREEKEDNDKNELKEEDRIKVKELKKASLSNINNYLNKNSNCENKDSIEELITELNNYINNSTKVEE